MRSFVWRFARRLSRMIDDVFPMPPDQLAARNWIPKSGEEQSRRRKLRLRIRTLEKRGRGGYR